MVVHLVFEREEFLTAEKLPLHGDDPFQAVAGRAAEEQQRRKVFVLQEQFEGVFDIGKVVEVEADQAGMAKQVAIVPRGEDAREGAVVEGSFVVDGVRLA
jgi:hypothetical protein